MASLLDAPHLIHAAKLIAVPIPFALAGYSLAYSQVAVPVLYDQKAEVSTPIFKRVFYDGANVVAPGSVITIAATAYLAYALPEQRSTWASVAGAIIFNLAWTRLVMWGNIHRLLEISESAALQEKATANLEHRQRLVTWVKQNAVRATTYLGAGVLAVRATLAA